MDLNNILGEKISKLTNTKFIKKEDIQEGMRILIRPIPKGKNDLKTKTPISCRGKEAIVTDITDTLLKVVIDGNMRKTIIDYVDVNEVNHDRH